MFKRLVTVYYYQDVSFSPNTSKPGNKGQLKGLVPTMGESSWEGGGRGEKSPRVGEVAHLP